MKELAPMNAKFSSYSLEFLVESDIDSEIFLLMLGEKKFTVKKENKTIISSQSSGKLVQD
jgi:hypothetical protein